MIERKKEILFSPSGKQEEFMGAALSGDYQYLLFGGAIRGGKTFCVLGTLLLLCKKYPGSRWAIVRDTLTTIKRNVIPSFFKICPTSFIKTYNQDLQVITLANGSEILLFSENFEEDKELNRWRGLEVNGFILEEANELQEGSFYKSIERAGTYIPRNGKKPKPLIMLTTNPCHNWVKTLFYDRYMNGTLPKGWMYLPSKITDNPFIASDEAYMASLKNMPRYEYEVFVNGNWEIQLKTGGEIYRSFELEKHVGCCEYNPSLPLHLSWDENVNPFLPAVVCQVKGKEIFVIDELMGRHPGNTVEAVCKLFAKRYKDHDAGLFIYGDATSQKRDTKIAEGHNFFTLIAGHLKNFRPSMRVLKSNPSVAMRCSFINAILEKEVFDLKISINEECKTTVADFILTKEDADGTKVKAMETDPKTKSRYQANGHMTDAFEYFIVSAFASLYKQYQRGDREGFPMMFGKSTRSNNNSYK